MKPFSGSSLAVHIEVYVAIKIVKKCFQLHAGITNISSRDIELYLQHSSSLYTVV